MSPTSNRLHADALSVQQMLTFCNVWELGGYSNAQERLGLAGPTLWEQVKAMERVYGTSLFERKGRNIRPTPAGDALYKILRPLLATVEASFDVLDEVAGASPKQLTVVTGVRMMLEELGPTMRSFMQSYPSLRLRLMTADNRSALKLILNQEADLALLIEPPADLVEAGIAYELLYPIEFLAAFPPRHRLARDSKATLAKLIDEPLVVGNSNTVARKLLEQAAFRLGKREPLQIAAETDNSAVTLSCVRAGFGIGIFAGIADGPLTNGLAIRSVAKDMGSVQVVAAYRKGRILSSAAKDLLEVLRQRSPVEA